MFQNRKLFTLVVFIFFCVVKGWTCNICNSLQFNYTVIPTGVNTSSVHLNLRTSVGTVDMAGMTVYFYYDNHETTIVGSDDSGVIGVPMNFGPGSVSELIYQPSINPNVPIVHTGYYFYQNIDDDLSGFTVTTTPVTVLVIHFEHSTGIDLYGGDGFLASTCEVSALAWVDDEFNGHDVCVLGQQAQPLPLDLLSFTAEKMEDGNRLKWRTTNEFLTSHFEIERSTNNENWSKIGQLPAQGFQNTIEDYEFDDNYSRTPLDNTIYYRLKMVDLDGAFDYSRVVSLNHNQPKELIIYPNPTSERLNFSGLGITQASVIDLQGRELKIIDLDPTIENQQLNIGSLSKGTYFLRFRGEDYGVEKAVLRFVKN